MRSLLIVLASAGYRAIIASLKAGFRDAGEQNAPPDYRGYTRAVLKMYGNGGAMGSATAYPGEGDGGRKHIPESAESDKAIDPSMPTVAEPCGCVPPPYCHCSCPCHGADGASGAVLAEIVSDALSKRNE